MQAEKMQCLKISFKELPYLGYYIVRHTRDHKGYKPFLRPWPSYFSIQVPSTLLQPHEMQTPTNSFSSPYCDPTFHQTSASVSLLLPCELGVTVLKTPNAYRASVHSARLLYAKGLIAARVQPFSSKGTPHSLSALPWGQGCTWNRNCVSIFFVMLEPWYYVIFFCFFWHMK